MQRTYNMILTKRSFNGKETTYALLGYENGQTWNLLGGKQDPGEDQYQAVARELYKESGKYFDKRNHQAYLMGLDQYKHGAHTVFIHPPGNLDCNISRLNEATNKCRNNKSLRHDFKEMHRYQLIKLEDLIDLAEKQTDTSGPSSYKYSQETSPMLIDQWLLYTIKRSGVKKLRAYV
jgi:NUDIX domain